MTQTTTINGVVIEYYYRTGDVDFINRGKKVSDFTITESSEEYIALKMQEGYVEGELCDYFCIEGNEREIFGHWKAKGDYNRYERAKELIDKLNYESINNSEVEELKSLFTSFTNELEEKI